MAKKTILLTNLGSPDSCDLKDIKKYLDEFLMDERVIDLPYILRYPFVKFVIVPFRAPKSAEKYRSIWTENGSPLVHITSLSTVLVAKQTGIPSYMCMRYGNPDPGTTLKKVLQENPTLEELILLPLYPHYAMSSFQSAVEEVKRACRIADHKFKLRVVQPFYNQKNYIDALCKNIKPFLKKKYDLILFSYHGIPERQIRKTDPTGNHCLKTENCCSVPSSAHTTCYRHQVIETTRLVAEKLNIPKNKYRFSFQSRLGSSKWLSPDTAEVLKKFPGEGIKKIIVVSPSFVSDCLETLQEVNLEDREIFIQSGGESFEFIPCLNLDPDWIKTISVLIKEDS